MVKPKITTDIKLDSIEISKQNVRDRDEIAGLEDLKLSISMYGVLQPIIAIEKPPGDKFELIVGQRRFRACQELGMKDIPARIYEAGSLTEQDKMILSLTENIQRRPLNKGSEIRVITKLYDNLGTANKVVNILGISPAKVSESLNLERFMTDDIQNLLDEGWLNKSQLKTIIKNAEGDKNRVEKATKKAIQTIKKGDYIGKQRTRAYETAANDPNISEEKLEKKIEERRYEDRVFIDLPYEYAKALKKAAKQTTGDIKDLIVDIIRSWLSDQGLVDEK